MRMHCWIGGLTVVGLAASASTAAAQVVVQSEISVPIISVFTVGTTVSVPDRGATYLGGIRSAATTSSETFPRLSRGFASRTRASDATVHVWIHDFQEMEESLGKDTEFANRSPQSGFGGRMQSYASSRPPQRLVINQSNAAQREPTSTTKATRDEERLAAKVEHAADLLKRGQDAESRGKLTVAKLYYKSVVSLGSTPSASAAQERLTALDQTKLAGR